MRSLVRLVLLGTLVVAPLSSHACQPGPGGAPAAAPVKDDWNHLARLLAGLPAEPGSPYARAARSTDFTAHRRSMDRFWKRVEAKTLEPVAGWRKRALAGSDARLPAIYPLSGADFVNLYALFPEAPSYLMFALEQPGRPDTGLTPGQTPGALRRLRSAIATIASKNYFYSQNMRVFLNKSEQTGTAAPLLAFLSRLGMRVVNVEAVQLSADGGLQPCATCDAAVRGTRYLFVAPGETRTRELVYLRIALDRDSLDPDKPVGAYLSRMKRFNVLLKSAVYLLHYDRWSTTRDWLIRHGATIVQDDSGIPYGSLMSAGRTVQLYGGYRTYRLKITGIGRPPRQRDLEQAYRRGPVGRVGFRFGYGGLSGSEQSTLMVVRP